MTCDSCGHRNADGATFCVACGAFLAWTTAEAPAVPSPAPAPPASVAPHAAGTRLKEPPSQALPSEVEVTEREDETAAVEAVVSEAAAVVERGRRLAAARDRPDLARHLDDAHTRLVEHVVPVAVVGEFKRGKSTLVNALLQRAVCPVDADVVTAVPTLVRYGEEPGATAWLDADGGEELRAEPVPLDVIAEYVSESGNPGNRRRVRSVEVRLRHRMLRTGLSLIDTPGVGGLDSAHGLMTLGVLDAASGMLFVVDASQELTAPELDFLREALRRCRVAACVLTKTDLYPEWRRIAALDEGHLRNAGLDLPVIPVSSFLRLGALSDPELTEESGFRALVEFLAGTVVRRSVDRAAAAAGREVRFVASQIGRQVEVERAVLEHPQQAERVVARLAEASERAARLTAPMASWQQVLNDRVQDLVADIEHDLQTRLRQVSREVERVIEETDPKESWPDVEAWLRREVAAAALANHDALVRAAEQVATEVATQFDLEAGTRVLIASTESDALSALEIGDYGSEAPDGQRAMMLLAARSTTGFLSSAVHGVVTAAGGLLVGWVVAPISLALAGAIGAKVVRDERRRQLVYRRQQAGQAAQRYLNDVAFVLGKDTRDALRHAQRQLRDEFQGRAVAIHRSTATALTAAQHASRLAPRDRAARAAELGSQSRELRRLRGEVTQPPNSTTGAPGG